MEKKHLLIVVISLTALIISPVVIAQTLVLPENYPEYEISVSNSPDEGYLFLLTQAIGTNKHSWLLILDTYGTPVYYKFIDAAAGNFSLQRNGHLSYRQRVGNKGKFFIMDSSCAVVDYAWMDDYILDSHDFLILENGHHLMFGLDARTVDLTAYGGIADATVTGCVIRELDRDKKNVFEWNSWDHYQISDTYKDLTVSSVDMVHPNSLDVDSAGNIFLLARGMNEVTKISRKTGEIIWRLGGKNNHFSFKDSSQIFSQPHDFRMLGHGHYTLFDNGNDRDPAYSRAIEYLIDEEKMSIEMVWEYDADKELFGRSEGSTRRLPSGNTILGYGGQASRPAAVEVHPDGSKAMQLDFTKSLASGKAIKFPWRTSLFEPNTYAVNFGEWDGYTKALYRMTIHNNADHPVTLSSYHTRTDAFDIKTDFPIEIPPGGDTIIWLTYFPININTGYVEDVLTINSDINSDTLVQRIAQQISLTGTKMDQQAPQAEISLASATNVPVDTTILIRLTEPIRKDDGTNLNYLTIDSLIVFKKENSSGEDVPFDAVISTDKKLISICPDSVMRDDQNYYISLSSGWEDFAGNKGSAVSSTFKTRQTAFPDGIYPAVPGDNKSVTIYPNPGSGVFRIDFQGWSERSIRAFDLYGREIYSSGKISGKSHLFELMDCPPGVYMIRVEELNNPGLRTIRLIKQ